MWSLSWHFENANFLRVCLLQACPLLGQWSFGRLNPAGDMYCNLKGGGGEFFGDCRWFVKPHATDHNLMRNPSSPCTGSAVGMGTCAISSRSCDMISRLSHRSLLHFGEP